MIVSVRQRRTSVVDNVRSRSADVDKATKVGATRGVVSRSAVLMLLG